MYDDVLIVIPSRMGATRLPGKPLCSIAGKPMIVHVFERAVSCDVARVVVACDDVRIVEAIHQVGGPAMLTCPDHATGSDRVAEILDKIDPMGVRYRHVINLQGDYRRTDKISWVN